MQPYEELELIISLIRKYDLPLSPILEYAIKEKMESVKDFNTLRSADSDSSLEGHAFINHSASLKERFRKYLFDSKSQRTARNYYSLIDGHIRKHISKIISYDADSVFSYTTTDELLACIRKLKADDNFVSENTKWHNALTASLNSYLSFIETQLNYNDNE